jgi:PKD repeat protein
MVRISRVLIAVAAAGLLVSGCTVKKTERPPLAGPSELALSLNLTANPDILTQDGSSQSRIVILALDANGQAVRGLPLHLGVTGAGLTLFGLLSNTDVTTGSDGRATVVYTAPPLPPDNVDRGALVTISAIPTGTDYANAIPRQVNIRLVPPTAVTPPPVAAFTFSPATAMPNSPVTFDASTSHADNGIASYTWDFGDGTTGSGMKPQHTYGREGSFTVALVIMDNTGRTSYPCTQTVTVATGAAPTASFVFSPTSAGPNQTIFFNASSSTASNGRKLVDYAWDFGNGTSRQGVTATTSYAAAGSYNVTLVVTDDAGRTASRSQTVSVTSTGVTSPTANFVFSPTLPSAGQTVLFNASGSTAGTGRTLVSYAWDFGNGQTGSGVTPSTSYATAGTYNVTLTVRDDLGQTAVKSQTLTVSASTTTPVPTAAFVFSPAAPTIGSLILFDASTSTAATGHSISSYAWTFGDGSTGTGRTYMKTTGYSTAGTYSVTLTVTDDLGQTASRSQSVTVTASTAKDPTAAFVYSPDQPAVGDPIFFDASSSKADAGHSIVSYAWTFGDGTPAGSGRTISKSYATTGKYTVVLTVTDDLGHTGITPNQVTVGAASTPTADFSISPSPAPVGVQVTVDASTSTTSVGQTIVLYEWNFGDSTTIYSTTSRTQAHSYTMAGAYTISLTITDSIGRKASAAKQLSVTATTANFGFSPSPGTAGVPITFDASQSTGTAPLSCRWNFGDSPAVFNTGVTTTHTYAAPGTYSVTLTVTDSAIPAVSASTSRSVIVEAPLVPNFVISPSPGVVNGVITFDASTSTGQHALRYSWTFGDSGTVYGGTTTATIAHTYSTAGTYTVTLTVTDIVTGSQATTTRSLVIQP